MALYVYEEGHDSVLRPKESCGDKDDADDENESAKVLVRSRTGVNQAETTRQTDVAARRVQDMKPLPRATSRKDAELQRQGWERYANSSAVPRRESAVQGPYAC